MFTLKKIKPSLLMMGCLALSATQVLAVPAVTVPNTFSSGGTIVADEMNANFAAVVTGINNMSSGSSSLPDGVTAGDLLYWDGSVWKLTPAPPVSTSPVALSLLSGVPTWTAETIYAIGDTGPAGGIVFYTTNGGKHGLEAAPTDLSDSAWGCTGIDIIGSAYSFPGAGAINALRVARQGCSSPPTTAATSYSLNGYADWYLPSLSELNLMYIMQTASASLPTTGTYWSSNDQGASNVVTVDMSTGTIYAYVHTDVYKVRAIRSF